MPLPKPRPEPRAVLISDVAGGSVLLLSNALGELFDRRPRSVGVTMLGTGAHVPKLLNRLENAFHSGSGMLEVSAQEVVATCEALLPLLPHLTDRWYWFANPGVPDEGRVRVEWVDVVGGELSAGHNECCADLPEGVRDLRDLDRYEFPAGAVEIRSESAEARYRADLHRAVAVVASRTTVVLSFSKPSAPKKGQPRTFERSALAQLPRGFNQAVARVCAPPLKALGFAGGREGRFERGAAAITFERGRFDNGTFAVHLERAARQATWAERPRFRSDVELAAQLRTSVEWVGTVGVAWLEDPDALDFDEWKARGLLDPGARRSQHISKLP